jgi:hypothetical protein
MLLSAVETYTKRTHQAPQFNEENLRWSAVCNITSEHTLEDLKNLADYYKEKYGFQCYQYAIHRDEGEPLFLDKKKTKPKLDKDGRQVYRVNYHGHLEFLMLNERGCTCFKKKDFGKKKMSEIQTEAAQILGMKRGKFFSDSVRLDHNQYRQEQRRIEQAQEIAREETRKEYTDEIVNVILVNEKLQKDLKENYVSKKDVKAEIEKARKEWIQESGHTAEDYKKLRALNQEQYKTIEELTEKIRNLEAELKAEKEKKQPDRQPQPAAEPQAPQAPQATQEQKQNLKEIFEIPEVKQMAKNLGEIAVTLNVQPDQDGIIEPKKIVDAAKALKAENSRLKTLITKATQAIKAKLKKPLITFTEGLKELLTWQQPDRQTEDQTPHLKNTLASIRNEISDLYRSQTNSEHPDRQESEQPEKPKKSRGFERY